MTSSLAGCGKLQELVIPETIVKLGPHAFKNCTSLVSVAIDGWRMFAPFSRHFAREIFVGADGIRVVDTPNSIVKQLGGVCKDIDKFKALPADIRGSKGRLSYFFWNASTHGAMCSANAKRSVLSVFQFAKGLGRVDAAPIAPLPFLPHEMWVHILSFVKRAELGRRTVAA